MASHRVDWRDPLPPECRGGVVTIGNFDGVHLGHAALVAEGGRQAHDQGQPAVALTFDPHPRELLRPEQVLPVLTTTEDRCRRLHELGADQVVVLRTTPDLLALRAADFFRKVVVDGLQACALVEGPSFGFGRGREGNVEVLGLLCRESGLALTVLPTRQVAGGDVSSSRVRAALGRGAVEEAVALLGRPYRLHGTVVLGSKRGRTLGFPTANLGALQTLAPGDGVYAGRAMTSDGTWPAAINVGPNPTFGEQGRKVEAHLIGFTGNLYGQPLAVDFQRRLRDIRPFAGREELVEQLRRDVAAVL